MPLQISYPEIAILAALLAATAGWLGLRRLRGAPAVPLPRISLPVDSPAPARPLPDPRDAELARLEDQLAQSREHIRSLEEQVSHYLHQYALIKDALRKETLAKNAASMELAAASAQVASLLARIHASELGHGAPRDDAARWKRHCRLLGAALKQERARNQAGAPLKS